MALVATIPDSMRTCSKCHKSQSLKLKFCYNSSKNSYFTICKACKRQREKARRLKNISKTRAVEAEGHLRRKYGLTLARVAEMSQEQGGVCKICKEPETLVWRGMTPGLSVDHDHNTGVVRGLLCHRCNVALAIFDRVPDALARIADYLGIKGAA